uniref:Uncharacterized protein n=1 Tax=Knipowitschia caucasica TaxID=637954 RepID=A0AAV2KC21_KNICA
MVISHHGIRSVVSANLIPPPPPLTSTVVTPTDRRLSSPVLIIYLLSPPYPFILQLSSPLFLAILASSPRPSILNNLIPNSFEVSNLSSPVHGTSLPLDLQRKSPPSLSTSPHLLFSSSLKHLPIHFSVAFACSFSTPSLTPPYPPPLPVGLFTPFPSKNSPSPNPLRFSSSNSGPTSGHSTSRGLQSASVRPGHHPQSHLPLRNVRSGNLHIPTLSSSASHHISQFSAPSRSFQLSTVDPPLPSPPTPPPLKIILSLSRLTTNPPGPTTPRISSVLITVTLLGLVFFSSWLGHDLPVLPKATPLGPSNYLRLYFPIPLTILISPHPTPHFDHSSPSPLLSCCFQQPHRSTVLRAGMSQLFSPSPAFTGAHRLIIPSSPNHRILSSPATSRLLLSSTPSSSPLSLLYRSLLSAYSPLHLIPPPLCPRVFRLSSHIISLSPTFFLRHHPPSHETTPPSIPPSPPPSPRPLSLCQSLCSLPRPFSPPASFHSTRDSHPDISRQYHSSLYPSSHPLLLLTPLSSSAQSFGFLSRSDSNSSLLSPLFSPPDPRPTPLFRSAFPPRSSRASLRYISSSALISYLSLSPRLLSPTFPSLLSPPPISHPSPITYPISSSHPSSRSSSTPRPLSILGTKPRNHPPNSVALPESPTATSSIPYILSLSSTSSIPLLSVPLTVVSPLSNILQLSSRPLPSVKTLRHPMPYPHISPFFRTSLPSPPEHCKQAAHNPNRRLHPPSFAPTSLLYLTVSPPHSLPPQTPFNIPHSQLKSISLRPEYSNPASRRPFSKALLTSTTQVHAPGNLSPPQASQPSRPS